MAANSKTILLESKMKKLERRALKKQARKIFALKNQNSELKVSDEPTRHIIVNNGGLMCGMERNDLLACFAKHGCVEALHMVPGKSFSVVSFKTVKESTRAFGEVNGQSISSPTGEGQKEATRILYLAYLAEEPWPSILCPSSMSFQPVSANQREQHPPGLIVIQDFISEQQERDLMRYFKIGDSCINNGDVKSSMKLRKVKHFGYEFIYGKNTVDKNSPLAEGIPGICDSVIDKMVEDKVIDWRPDQLTMNQYEPGQGIPPHIDTHSAFTNGIISLSLGSQVVMEFCHPDGRQISLILPERSLLVMTSESRYLWTHGITPRKTDIVLETDSTDGPSTGLTLKERGFRMSLTFRKTLLGPCKCPYPAKCDSQGFKAPTKTAKSEIAMPNSEIEARQLESKHVNDVYDHIADHFSDTRHSPWPKVARFLNELPNGSLVADAGCGNGKYLAVNKDIVTFGSDRSVNLVQICRDRGHCAIVCDILKLPYRSNSFDAAISIAVIHHLSTFDRRAAAVRELVRIVKPNGLILISVWALEQNIGDDGAEKRQSKTVLSKLQNGGRTDECNSDEGERRKQEGIAEPEISLENSVATDADSSPDESEKLAQNGKISDSCSQRTDDNTTNKAENENLVSGKDKLQTEELPSSIIVNESRNVFKQQDLLVPWHFRGKQEKRNKGSVDNSAGKVKEPKSEEVFHRYYHVFIKGELETVCRQIENVAVVNSYHDRGNWCVILQKVNELTGQ